MSASIRTSMGETSSGSTALELATRPNGSTRTIAPSYRRYPAWLRAYRRRVIAIDVAVVLASVMLAQWADLGIDDSRRVDVTDQRAFYLGLGFAIALVWLAALNAWQSWSVRLLGSGHEEYTRILRATGTTFGLLTILAVTMRVEEFRGYLFVAAPIGTTLLLGGRFLLRRDLAGRRRRGTDHYKVLLVGRPESAAALISRMHQDITAGHQAVGLCLPDNSHGRLAADRSQAIVVDGQEIPVYGTWREIAHAVLVSDACTVAVMSSESLDPDHMKELSWQLDTLGVDMVVAPNLVDVHQMRLTTRPVAGLPLLQLEGPRYELANRVAKALFDRIGSGLLILAASPVLLACAAAVKLTSRGPVFYTADRIGLDGRAFPMIKFRSMVVGADAMKAQLSEQNESDGVLFKMKDDPRVTRVGRVMRRYSLDELPQLFNVFAGHMSLVGPRPPLLGEVEQYDAAVARRLYVRPGMTGLWQVSGRSNLSWEESVRLDLSYVENWSMGLDIIILWRTARAVLGSDGAY